MELLGLPDDVPRRSEDTPRADTIIATSAVVTSDVNGPDPAVTDPAVIDLAALESVLDGVITTVTDASKF
ncbi:hypothetical protein N7495_009162 [Penicillium taxi]|uniref:uncharacterized protein n=1 Tax=Penicillium taxi TaxID=168475 RepID=UPI00254589A1|nr:uncharacterized protein N7495_009162 [Penicillium taxi]KAJ5884652.1 hypothetical protein N7495_009162 [Penicillium taxi]